jgi:uncharacterized protein HemY
MALTASGLEPVDEHARALQRLEDAMNRQAHLDEVYRRSLGTQRELGAFMRLRDARKQVTAFEKWLRWVDDEDNANAPPGENAPSLDEVLGH